MALKTLAQLASRALRDAQIPEDSSTASVQAVADAKLYLNEGAEDVWSRRHWREYNILGSFTVPAGVQLIRLTDIVPDTGYNTSGNGIAATFNAVSTIRESTNALFPEDAGAINSVQPDLWAATTTPVKFVSLGQKGIMLLGSYGAATPLNFFGKANFRDIADDDADTWIMGDDSILVDYAVWKLLQNNDRDDNRASARQQAYEAGIAKLVDAAEVQSGNIKRIVPVVTPDSAYDSIYNEISKTGINL